MNGRQAALVVAPLLLACAIAPARAAQAGAAPTAANRPAEAALLAGEYRLEGVMETGSGLLLRADGSFEWFFSYGALDLAARGRWERERDGIALVVEDLRFPPQMPQASFTRMHLRTDGADLVPSWPWDVDALRKGAEHGRYVQAGP